MSQTAIIYGSTTGNTEEVAGQIAAKIPGSELINISDLSLEKLESYQNILLGTSTWGLGELQDDWIDGVDLIAKANLSGKKVGFFGLGDQMSYADTFVDGMGIIYEAIKDSGANLVGQFSADGISYDSSRAAVDGKFVGLVIDVENQSDLTEQRISSWVAELGL